MNFSGFAQNDSGLTQKKSKCKREKHVFQRKQSSYEYYGGLTYGLKKIGTTD